MVARYPAQGAVSGLDGPSGLNRAVLAVTGLLLLAAWRFDTGTGRTEPAASTAVAPLLTEAETCPGVRSARGSLAGTRDDPALALVISTDQYGGPAVIRHALATRGLPRLCRALDLDELPTTVEFRFTGTSRTAAGPNRVAFFDKSISGVHRKSEK